MTTATPTAPLPAIAVDAMRRLELRLFAPEVLPAVARYEIASFRTAQMSRWMNTRDLTDAELGDLEFAQDTMRQARATLAAAGQLHLIEVDR
ncbi:hypothetical protein ACWDBD_17245 [Streptomyces sp. NPDC001118]